MSLEEVGAYALLMDHMYMKGGPIKDTPTFIAGLLGVDVRVWHRIRASLLRKGKITETGDGFLFNRRVSDELEDQAELRKKRSKAGRVSGQKRAERNELSFSYGGGSPEVDSKAPSRILQQGDSEAAKYLKTKDARPTRVEHVNEQNRTDRERDREDTSSKEDVVGLPPTPPAPHPLAGKGNEAVKIFADAAQRAGWVIPRDTPNQARKRAVMARLRECGGLDGWRQQIALAEAQPFLGGSNERGWRMSLDWLLKPANWQKVAECYYNPQAVAQTRADDGLGEWRAICQIRRQTGAWPTQRTKRNERGERLPFSPEMVPDAVRVANADLFTAESPAPSLFVIEGGR